MRCLDASPCHSPSVRLRNTLRTVRRATACTLADCAMKKCHAVKAPATPKDPLLLPKRKASHPLALILASRRDDSLHAAHAPSMSCRSVLPAILSAREMTDDFLVSCPRHRVKQSWCTLPTILPIALSTLTLRTLASLAAAPHPERTRCRAPLAAPDMTRIPAARTLFCSPICASHAKKCDLAPPISHLAAMKPPTLATFRMYAAICSQLYRVARRVRRRRL
mmetsp:Transcript_40537/g.101399  ORF Transcript_40537/g.101399 Transcript_40537/m.101399 type:complete len:222 (-) Transcript_40537:1157-1822(-)